MKPRCEEAGQGNETVEPSLDPGLHINAFRSLLYLTDLAQNLLIMNRSVKGDERIPLCLKGYGAALPPDRMDDTVKNGAALPIPKEDQVSPFQGGAGNFPQGEQLSAAQEGHHASACHSHTEANAAVQDIFKKSEDARVCSLRCELHRGGLHRADVRALMRIQMF